MKISISKLFLVTSLIFLTFTSCSTVPVTGRQQLDLIADSELLAMSYKQYDNFLSSNKVSSNKKQTALVKSVGSRIQKAVEKFMRENNLADELKNYDWEFNLVESEEVNAWCMPGGKVVFYTGILPVCEDENGVAVVMGHEVAHAIAQHGSERMSQGLMTQLGGAALGVALKDEPEETKALWFTAYGIGAQVGVLLPYSRLHESEADHLGLIFMAMAGYNPNESVEFWKRMSANKKGGGPPEFLSTHPSDETRINDLQKLIPEAMKYYKK
jgi:predicted Zn-dependent protease